MPPGCAAHFIGSAGVVAAAPANGGSVYFRTADIPGASATGRTRRSAGTAGRSRQGQPAGQGRDQRTGRKGRCRVVSASVAPGDANCPDGGSKFTPVSGDTYACNRAKGDKGDPGPVGAQGPPARRDLKGRQARGAKCLALRPYWPAIRRCRCTTIRRLDRSPSGACGTARPCSHKVRFTNATSSTLSVNRFHSWTAPIAPGGDTFVAEQGRSVIGPDVRTMPGATAPATGAATSATAVVEFFSRGPIHRQKVRRIVHRRLRVHGRRLACAVGCADHNVRDRVWSDRAAHELAGGGVPVLGGPKVQAMDRPATEAMATFPTTTYSGDRRSNQRSSTSRATHDLDPPGRRHPRARRHRTRPRSLTAR